MTFLCGIRTWNGSRIMRELLAGEPSKGAEKLRMQSHSLGHVLIGVSKRTFSRGIIGGRHDTDLCSVALHWMGRPWFPRTLQHLDMRHSPGVGMHPRRALTSPSCADKAIAPLRCGFLFDVCTRRFQARSSKGCGRLHIPGEIPREGHLHEQSQQFQLTCLGRSTFCRPSFRRCSSA